MTEPGNRLSGETSPYLRQHADNPVDWWAWGPEAFAAAREQNKPILLSVGYAACHWCHVMAHESFESEETAALMNERFINIKVDREERPDVDHIYQASLGAMGQQGGWPLTMFLTPTREPFWGGTYFPPESKYGRAGFSDVLTQVSDIYHGSPEKVENNTEALTEALTQQTFSQPGEAGIEPVVMDRMAERVVRDVDPEHGGIGGAPKFPHFGVLELIWRHWQRTKDHGSYDAVAKTLEAMCQGGIYDHLGGGFARYATDEAWLVPHFEKMLYDNAQAIELLTEVFLGSANKLFRARLFETVDWALRDMMVEHDGKAAFAATLDADSEGEEGKFYVWSEDEIDALLADKAPGFKAAYDVTGLGNWEGSNILNRRGGTPPADEVAEKKLADARDTLFRARADRVPPGRDDKVLADWNGMMIAALARAAFVFEQDDWMAAARGAYDFVTANLGADTALAHSWHAAVEGVDGGEPQLRGLGTLDDYAQMARAALTLYQYQGDVALLQQAQRWVDHLNNHFWNSDHGGYFMASDLATDLIVRPRHAVDQATPSGNGVMVEVLASLFYLTGDQAYLERMEALVQSFSGEIERNFFPLGTLINNIDYMQRCRQVVVVGRADEAMTEGLIDGMRRRSRYDLLLSVVDEGDGLPGGHPAKGKSRVEDQPTAYLCMGMACQPPVTQPADLAALLDQPGGHAGANDNSG